MPYSTGIDQRTVFTIPRLPSAYWTQPRHLRRQHRSPAVRLHYRRKAGCPCVPASSFRIALLDG